MAIDGHGEPCGPVARAVPCGSWQLAKSSVGVESLASHCKVWAGSCGKNGKNDGLWDWIMGYHGISWDIMGYHGSLGPCHNVVGTLAFDSVRKDVAGKLIVWHQVVVVELLMAMMMDQHE